MPRSCTYYDNQRRLRCTECGIGVDLCQCDDPDHRAHVRVWSEDGLVIRAIFAELQEARRKHPVPKHMLAALTEETGEVANALIEHELGTKPATDVFKEAVQVAVCALRIAVEGDTEFTYEPYAIFGGENKIP